MGAAITCAAISILGVRSKIIIGIWSQIGGISKVAGHKKLLLLACNFTNFSHLAHHVFMRFSGMRDGAIGTIFKTIGVFKIPPALIF